MKKEELPWRSLLAYQDIAGVRGKYYVPHIPHTLLVYPDGNFEPFNLWEENEINKLYALTGNKAKLAVRMKVVPILRISLP